MKKTALRLALVLFGVLLLATVEGGLRLLWTPPALPGEELAQVAIDPFRVESGVARTDPAFKGAMQAATFAVPKPPGRFRIFCLGGSTTMGYPSPPDAAWPAVLERRLRALHPGREVEVINVGGNSYGTGRVLGVLRGILKYQPDLLIVATGDTEFVEDSFRTAVAVQSRKIGWLHDLYLSRAIKGMLPKRETQLPVIDARDAEVAGFVFAPMPDSTVYKVTAERRQAVMAGMAENLAGIAALAREAGIPLMLCTLPSNLTEWPPDPDAARPDDSSQRLEWEALWERGRRLAGENRMAAALEQFAAAARTWDGNAEFCYEYGQLLLQAGSAAQARQWLARARDLDPTPVRATTEVQALLRQAATGKRVFLADLAGRFDDLTLDGDAGNGLIFDYAHPTPRGHAEIAATVGRTLASALPGWEAPSDAVADVEAAERERAARVVIEQNADLCYVLGEVFERKGLLDRAEEMYRRAIALGNRGPLVRYNLATVLARQGELPAALELANRLAESHPDWSRSFVLLGFLYEQTGQAGEALGWYRRAIAAGQSEQELFGATGRLLLRQGEAAEAREILRQGLARYPDDCRLSAQFGETLEAGRDLSGAEAHYRQALARDPGCQQAWEGLGLVLMNLERWTEAAEVFQTALRQPDPLPFHHLNLGIVYYQGMGNRQLAAEQFSAFLALQPDKLELVPPPFRPAAGRAGVKR